MQQQNAKKFLQMQISEFIKKKGITWTQFGDMCGITRQTVWYLMNKKHRPTLDTIDKITKGTANQVTINDLRA